jgi:hypothetical protein
MDNLGAIGQPAARSRPRRRVQYQTAILVSTVLSCRRSATVHTR